MDQAVKGGQLTFGEPQPVQIQDDPFPVQDADHHALPEEVGQRRDPEVDVPPLVLEAETPVLGEAPFGDVHPGHNLEAGQDRRLQALGGRLRVKEHAVLAVAHPELVLKRLQVNVAGPDLDGPGNQQVHQLNDGRLPGHVTQVADLGGFLVGDLDLLNFDATHQSGHGTPRQVNLINGRQHVCLRNRYGSDGRCQHHFDGALGLQVIGIGHGQDHPTVFLSYGQAPSLF